MRVTTTSLEVAQPIIFGIFHRTVSIFSSRDNNERIISREKKERKKREREKRKKTEFSARSRTNQNWVQFNYRGHRSRGRGKERRTSREKSPLDEVANYPRLRAERERDLLEYNSYNIEGSDREAARARRNISAASLISSLLGKFEVKVTLLIS